MANQDVHGSLLTDGTVTASKMATNSVNTTAVSDGAVTAAKLAATLDLSAKTLTLPAANTPVFTKSYQSASQTITSAGTLTLAHSLGGKPKIIRAYLVCTSAEQGYSIGDEVEVPCGAQVAAEHRGLGVKSDATNIVLRFGSDASAMCVIHGTSGNAVAITNLSWNLVVRAFA